MTQSHSVEGQVSRIDERYFLILDMQIDQGEKTKISYFNILKCTPRVCQTYLQECPSYFNSTINMYYEYTSG